MTFDIAFIWGNSQLADSITRNIVLFPTVMVTDIMGKDVSSRSVTLAFLNCFLEFRLILY